MPPWPERADAQVHANLAAVVLAGGASMRMGTDKAFLDWEGMPLLGRQIGLLRFAGAQFVCISGRSGVDYSAFGCPVVHDAMEHAGPIAGLVAALRWARGSHAWLLALAVDLPCMTGDYLAQMTREVIASGLGMIPQRGSYFEPLAAVYPVELALAVAEAQIARQRYALQDLASSLIQQNAAHALPIMPDERVLFANWNDTTGPQPMMD